MRGGRFHPDPKRRYWAAIISGIGYVVMGLLAGAVTAFVALAPPVLIQAVAGLALVGAFSGSALSAFKEPKDREAAAITFLVSQPPASRSAAFPVRSGVCWPVA